MSAQPGVTKTPVVMQIIPRLGAGGAEQGCIDVCAELVRAGAQSFVVCNGGARIHEIARAGGNYIQMPVDSKNPFRMIANIFALRKLIRKYNVDIVHARSRAPAWSALLAVRGTDARFMTTCHAPYNFKGGLKRFYNSSIARGERVIAISSYVADYLKNNYKIDPGIIRTIHRGIAIERFHPTTVTPERMIKLMQKWRLPDGVPVVMLPGRITRWKGHHVLINAMAALGRKDVIAVLIGDDQGRAAYRAELEDSIRSLGLEGQIRLVTHCDDMPAAYMLSTVVISASTDPEGFGRIPVEAQAMGRPVVGTDHGGARETILRGETGWLVPPGDSRAMAQAIQEALSLSPQQRAVLATRAMSHIVQNFTREKMTDATLNVYAELLDEKMRLTAKPARAAA